MKHALSEDVLCNMCLVYDGDGRILVQMRTKKDWPGLTLPGGHVEKGEHLEDSIRREMKEETGLALGKVELMGVLEWDFPNVDHYLAFLYRCGDYSGTLKSSSEGDVFFIERKDIGKYPLSMDMDKILEIVLKDFPIKEGGR